jgi:hypothetical protein
LLFSDWQVSILLRSDVTFGVNKEEASLLSSEEGLGKFLFWDEYVSKEDILFVKTLKGKSYICGGAL